MTAFVLAVLALPACAAPVVWVAPSLERVGPSDAAGSVTEVDLYAAKGEWESFQIIVRAPSGGLSDVNVTAPALGGPEFTLYREHYVYVSTGSTDWYTNRNKPLGPGWYPDGLIPFVDPETGQDLAGAELDAVPFDLASGKNQPIWVDVFVPRSAAAGQYQGTFTVTSDQGQATVPFRLTVWDFTLPLQPSLKSCILYWNVRRDLAADQELLRHRLMPFTINLDYERSLVDTLGLNATNAGFWSGASGSSGTINPAPSVATFQQAAAQHEPEVHLYNYTADEVGSNTAIFDELKEWARNMHAAGIDNLITMAPLPALYDDGSGTGRSVVDIWALLPKGYVRTESEVKYVISKGDEVWSYNTMLQDSYSPKWRLDFLPINYRIQPGFINQSLDLTGLLYWRADLWSSDPWNDVEVYSGSAPGEALLVYPAGEVGLPGVIGSMRLKYLRDGVDDYEYIALLKQQGLGDWALSVAATVGPDWENWTRDADVLEAARRELGEMLNSQSPHTLSVSASASPTTVPSQGTTSLSATAQDSLGHAISDWSWSDGGAGGSFSPSSSVQNPTYTAPENATTAAQQVTLSLTATCADASPASGSSHIAVTVLPEGATHFPDVPVEHWAYDSIIACVDAGIASGYPDGYYRPSQAVTRAEMAAHIARALAGAQEDVPAGPAAPTFPDVAADHWAYDFVEYVCDAGIASGYADGYYRPDWDVTRAQMAVFMSRSVVSPTGDDGLADYVPPEDPTFPDVSQSDWAYKYVEHIAANDIAQGYPDGSYKPMRICERDQMAVYLARAFGLLAQP
jgi:hypothetical protein